MTEQNALLDFRETSRALGNNLHEALQPRSEEATTFDRLKDGIPGDTAFQNGVLTGAMVVLHALGGVRIDAAGIRHASPNAGYFIASLAVFLEAFKPAITNERVFAHMCKDLESRRLSDAALPHEPLNRATIVNVIVKTKKIRQWRHKAVFLHVYHDEWGQYHLVGTRPRPDESTEDTAHRALEDILHLDRRHVELLNPRTEGLKLNDISGSHGAYTEYTYLPVLAKRIGSHINLHALSAGAPHRFRWFTKEEVMKRQGDQGEQIMFSTPAILEALEFLDEVTDSISSKSIDDSRSRSSLRDEIGRRFTSGQILTIGLSILIGLALLIWGTKLVDSLTQQNQLLTNIAALAGIASMLLGGFQLIAGFRRRS